MSDHPRLIETAFPLKQASLDSVHEKNVRHGHISTLHIWPARRPLAACRAALIATLLPDPGSPDERQKLVEKIGGKVVLRVEKKKVAGKTVETIREETEGGVLHWGRENNPDMDWFRAEIHKAYGGRAPKVLDPFAGGGAIPLEAMRLGCEATAVDINPVAWFILKCTLEYPQRLVGQKRPLPAFVLQDREFMEEFFKAQGYKGTALRAEVDRLSGAISLQPVLDFGSQSEIRNQKSAIPEADLAWHVRAWGRWVLNNARQELARFYPIYADFQPLTPDTTKWKKRDRQLASMRPDGAVDLDVLNAEFNSEYLADKKKPRWVPKPTVAYLWARTVTCKNCRAVVPLLKTRWLCKKEKKRIVLTMKPNADKTGVVFGVQNDVPLTVGTAAKRREHDKQVGAGTMSRSGAACPCCSGIMTMEDIRLEGQVGRLGTVLTAVVVDGTKGKEYRLPTEDEVRLTLEAEKELEHVFAEIPFGLPNESTPAGGGSGAGRAFSVQGYGIMRWRDLYSYRQLLALGTLVKNTRAAQKPLNAQANPAIWGQAISVYLALAIDRVANRASTLCIWNMPAEKIEQTFARFALPIMWDFAESNPLADASGNYAGEIDWIGLVCSHLSLAAADCPDTKALSQSAQTVRFDGLDIVVTDPPYYDAIPYSDLMDFFYIWLRRTLYGLSPEIDYVLREPLSPKWNHDDGDGELIDDASRHGGDSEKSKAVYEEGMFHSFQACHQSLKSDGRLVIVFAHKHPDAWETLVSAIIRAGFVVDGSWPIQTERTGRMRANTSAALASSVWLVCKKRPESARPGWDNRVLDEMRTNIYTQLRAFWDAGIRGPDFVWAATGPAMEAYSQHPVVKKANEPGQLMTVSEFLRHVRRIVVDFVVGRVLFREGDDTSVSGLDDITTYYLLHRHDFGLGDAPIGACILYAVSCGLSDSALADQHDILIRTGGKAAEEEEEAEESEGEEETTEAEESEGTGSVVRLKPWNKRVGKGMGYDPAVDSSRAKAAALQPVLLVEAERPLPKSRAMPLIDQVHRLMHLWKAGDVVIVNEYIDDRALRRNMLFHQLLQALIELAPAGSEERALLESLSNHLAAKGVEVEKPKLFDE